MLQPYIPSSSDSRIFPLGRRPPAFLSTFYFACLAFRIFLSLVPVNFIFLLCDIYRVFRINSCSIANNYDDLLMETNKFEVNSFSMESYHVFVCTFYAHFFSVRLILRFVTKLFDAQTDIRALDLQGLFVLQE